jgi:AraC-like DNA-binding protein
MARDSIFRIASIAEPITATAVMMSVEDGLIAEPGSSSPVCAPAGPVDDVVRAGARPVVARCYARTVTPDELANLAHLRRARDLIDREYARPLDVPAMARHALMSPAHFSRRFRASYGETPYGYLMTRRIERAMALLRAGSSVTDACMAVGCTSLGSFSSRFTELVGETPSAYRSREHTAIEAMPPCVAKVLTRPARNASSRIEEAVPAATA